MDEVTGVDQVADEDLDRGQEQVHVGGDLGDRQRAVLAEAQYLAVFPVQAGGVGLGAGGHDQGEDVQAVQVLAGPAPGHRERADQEAGVLLARGRAAAHGAREAGGSAGSTRGPADKAPPTCCTITFIS